MGLKLSNGRDLTSVDAGGNVLFLDPSITAPGPQAALVEKAAFLTMLERENISAVWIIAGEKNVYGRKNSYGGRRAFTGIYCLKDGEVTLVDSTIKWDKPSKTQLQTFLDEEE